jgi:hypothetical protein
MVTQISGVGRITSAASGVREILREFGDEISFDELSAWLDWWSVTTRSLPTRFDYSAERLGTEDLFQRMFSDGILSGGNLSPIGIARSFEAHSKWQEDKADPELWADKEPWEDFFGWLAMGTLLAATHADRTECRELLDGAWAAAETDMARPLYDPKRGDAVDEYEAEPRLYSHRYFAIWNSALIWPLSMTRWNSFQLLPVDIEATESCSALSVFHIRNGRYPGKLTELTPDLIDSVPIDPYDGKPLKYRLTDDGGDFVLYSVAGDFEDNGAQHEHAWQRGRSYEFSPPPEPVDFVFWPPQPSD